MRQTPPHILRRIREAHAQHAARLDLSGERLTRIPEEVYDLAHLEELDLRDNLIQTVPDDLRRLTRLREGSTPTRSTKKLISTTTSATPSPNSPAPSQT